MKTFQIMQCNIKLEFTPLEFETAEKLGFVWADIVIRIYSVGV